MSGKVKEVAKEEFEQAKVLASDAVRSGAYLYPLKVSPICEPRKPGIFLRSPCFLATSETGYEMRKHGKCS